MSFRFFLSAAVMAAAVSSAADAATVSYLSDAGLAPGAVGAPTSTTGTVNTGLTTTVSGQYVSPWEGSAFFGTGTYTSVQGGATATFALGSPTDTVVFLWGTPDTWNTLSFYSGGTLVDSITGGSVVANYGTSAYVSIKADGLFDTIEFASSTNAFEFAVGINRFEAPAPVPVPAAGLLLVGGLAGIGALARRRKG